MKTGMQPAYNESTNQAARRDVSKCSKREEGLLTFAARNLRTEYGIVEQCWPRRIVAKRVPEGLDRNVHLLQFRAVSRASELLVGDGSRFGRGALKRGQNGTVSRRSNVCGVVKGFSDSLGVAVLGRNTKQSNGSSV